MVIYHANDLRKISGGVKGRHVKVKRKYWMGRPPIETLPGREKRISVRTRGGNMKVKVKFALYANVIDPKTGQTRKVRILRVSSNPSNKDYDRRGVITKGAIIETEIGRAKVSSRPGQDGVVNAILL
ncbi:MAG: 30S ribosomal protein S8e [Thermofilaceae archaeon]|nr:30S ribosomal protein S8e [Thermofilaceae archaeon]MCX8180526.1 30S ribosomal protein S8e [Thermofilaceae archaeon]MDW8003278.1 30S ribosomal protein S8e [Thermofilaceae archaeon]